MAHRMAAFPRWQNLKHFNSVTTTQFTDGQAFYDILKVLAAYVWLAFFWLLMAVYSAMYRWFSSEKLGPSPLHPSLPVFSNPGWPTMYDWKSAQETSTGFVCIWDAVRGESCSNSTFMLFAIIWLIPQLLGRSSGIWQELQFPEATRYPSCNSRCA